jgi:hypothetical protein
MAEEQPRAAAEGGGETLMEKIADKLHIGGDGSSSDSDADERKQPKPSAPPAPAEVATESFVDSAAAAAAEAKAKVFRLFGREEPIHKVLGGGKRMAALSLLMISLSVSKLIWFEFVRAGGDGLDLD